MTLLEARGRVVLERGDLTLDLRVDAGEVVGLVGPNGAGKTATLLTLLGLHQLAEGQVRVGGRIVDDGRSAVPPHERGLGWVPQTPALLPRARARRQVAHFARADAPLGPHGPDGLLDALGLSARQGTRPTGLSGGEAQRVAVARALACAHLVLMDEPTAAQDADGAARVRRLVREHAHAGGGAVVVAHRPEDAYAFADRLVVMEQGTVVQSGTPAELAAAPATAYIAHVVGATVVTGTIGDDHVIRGAWGELTVPDDTDPGPASAVVRPDSVVVHREAPHGSSRNVVRGVVTAVDDRATGVTIRIEAEPALVATVTHAAAAALDLQVGVEVWASVKAHEVVVTPAATHG